MICRRRPQARRRRPEPETPHPKLNERGEPWIELLDIPLAKDLARLSGPIVAAVVAILEADGNGDQASVKFLQDGLLRLHGWAFARRRTKR